MPSNRNIRVNALLQREISMIMHTRHQAETVCYTVTKVDVSPNHKTAIVFYSVINSKQNLTKAKWFFKNFAGQIRDQMKKVIVLKNLPWLEFKYDPSLEKSAEMIELMEDIEQNDTNQS